MMDKNISEYKVKTVQSAKPIEVTVPGSKSITNRALMLAAISKGKCVLENVLFSDDSRAFLECLEKLGFELKIEEEARRVSVKGCAGKVPDMGASINVRSAGTAARFITVMLAMAGGSCKLDSSEQMKKRPMQPLLDELASHGVRFTYKEEKGHFPFILESENEEKAEKESGIEKRNNYSIDTAVSSQFASALIMAAPMVKGGLYITLTGERIKGSYIQMTLEMMKQFGFEVQEISCTEGLRELYIPENHEASTEKYYIEPDMSAAAYFYAGAAILGTTGVVKGVKKPSLQGDIRFLDVLSKMGAKITEAENGIKVEAGAEGLDGITINMKDFSDQVLTLAAIAPFAKGTVKITNIGHIKKQECDRVNAVIENLTRLGIKAVEDKENDGIIIEPCTKKEEAKEIHIETYNDHRVAMAFALTGLKIKGVVIDNPMCCKKTFENYFEVFEKAYYD